MNKYTDCIWWKYLGTIQRNVHCQPHFDIWLSHCTKKKTRICKILLKKSQNQQKDEWKRKKR